MPPEIEPTDFQTFFAAKVKDRGVSIKKLSETTGIAPAHIVSMMYGRYGDLPSAPYVRGYLARLGRALDFDGEAWWERIKRERLVSDSGSSDALPNNRFIRRSPAKFIWLGAAALIILIYLVFQIPIILGKPSLAVVMPSESPFTTASSTFTFQGTVRDADSLALNGDSVAIAQDGSWEKSVLLQNGLNSFQLTAKKLLGGETDITEQVIYQAPGQLFEGNGVSPVGTTTAATTSTATSSFRTPASSTLPTTSSQALRAEK